MSNGRSSPRLSVNQLATYLVATPSQRRRIIYTAKYPPTFTVNWYDFARQAIADFVTGGMTNEAILGDEITRLYGLTAANDYEESRNRTNAEALEGFLDCYDQIEDSGLSLQLGPSTMPVLTVQSVDISVRPEFLLQGVYRNQNCVGGIKLYFSKDNPLTADSAHYITAVVMLHVQNHCQPPDYTTRHANCQVVDVFARCVHAAPRAVTRRFQDIEAACQEIDLRWPSV